MSDDARTERLYAGRRTLLRAGVATAWAVPVVQVVTAAPAAAACSGLANLSTSTKDTWAANQSSKMFTGNFTVVNSGGASTVALTAVFTATGGGTVTGAAPTGWTGTFPTYTANSQVTSCGGQLAFPMSFSFTSGNLSNMSVTLTTAGGTGTTLSQAV